MTGPEVRGCLEGISPRAANGSTALLPIATSRQRQGNGHPCWGLAAESLPTPKPAGEVTTHGQQARGGRRIPGGFHRKSRSAGQWGRCALLACSSTAATSLASKPASQRRANDGPADAMNKPVAIPAQSIRAVATPSQRRCGDLASQAKGHDLAIRRTPCAKGSGARQGRGGTVRYPLCRPVDPGFSEDFERRGGPIVLEFEPRPPAGAGLLPLLNRLRRFAVNGVKLGGYG